MIIELFCIIISYLTDKEKISLIQCSTIFYNYKLLIKFNSTYDLSYIQDNWCMALMKKIIIKSLSCKGINSFIEGADLTSIIINDNCVRWVSVSSSTKIALQCSDFHDLIEQ